MVLPIFLAARGAHAKHRASGSPGGGGGATYTDGDQLTWTGPRFAWDPSVAFPDGGRTIVADSGEYDGNHTAESRAIGGQDLDGKRYFELFFNARNGDQTFGMADLAYDSGDQSYYVGGDYHTPYIGYRSVDGNVLIGGETIGYGLPFPTSGQSLCVAVDVPNRTVWFRTNAGLWNNDPSVNPATGVGGFVVPGPYYPLRPHLRFDGGDLTDSVTLNSIASTWNYTAPAGFSAPGATLTGSGDGGPSETAWTPAALGALDRIRWEWSDASSVTTSGGFMTGVTNKGGIGSSASLVNVGDVAYADGVADNTTSSGSLTSVGAVNVADVFADMQTGLWYGIVTFVGGIVWFKAEGWGNRLGFEGSNRVDWPQDQDSSGKLQGWSSSLDGTPRILTVRRTSSGKTVRLNGVEVAADTSTLPFGGGATHLNLFANDNGGDLLALCTFRGAMGIIDANTLDVEQKVEGWLAWMMNTAGDPQFVTALPSDHPFKSAAPTA